MKNVKCREIIIKSSDGLIIRGKINLNAESKPMDRISDVLSQGSSHFITLFDIIQPDNMGKTIILNKHHIIWAIPVEEGNPVSLQ